MKELSAELSSPSDAIFDRKSSQCWINVESGSDVSQVVLCNYGTCPADV